MRTRFLGLATVAIAISVVLAPVATDASTGAARAATTMFPGCAATGSPIKVGTVACELLPSPMIGGTTAFSYYVPPDCAPALRRRCPTLYLLHGFGGDATEMVGTAAHPSAWVAAETSAPPGTAWESQPWLHADPAGWTARPALDMVLIAPDGRTVPGGFGPAPGLDGYWVDWNPRYGKGGSDPRYSTPAPRFAGELDDELIPYVERHFPVGAGRAWRAIAGVSLGGFGAYVNGLTHPDVWSSMGSISGALNFLFAPGLDPTTATLPVGVAPPVATPHVDPPGVANVAPRGAVPLTAQDYLAATLAFGDPAADQAYFRGHTPRDLAINARAFAGHEQALYIKGSVNDMVARRAQDVGDTPFEVLVFPMNMDQQAAFLDEGVADDFAIHPGVHSDPYRNAWLRGQEEAQYARLRHWDGGGAPVAAPTTFDYRSTDASFSVWGWKVSVARPDIEFVELQSVSCHGLTVRGTGVVTFTVPPSCGTGVKGKATFSVDLGPSTPLDEPAGLGASPAYGRTVTVALTRIAP